MRYQRTEFLHSDPIQFVHRFRNPLDQEAVALISALLAYGGVKQILGSVGRVLDTIAALSNTPHEFVEELDRLPFRRKAKRAFTPLYHRFNRGEDFLELFSLLGKSWKRHGSLGGHVLSLMGPKEQDFEKALSELIAEWRSWSRMAQMAKRSSFQYLLTSPVDGSACKRWCMFFRWMVRKDEVDPGLWTATSGLAGLDRHSHRVGTHQLVIPIDTHTGRISQYIGLTQRKTLDWKMAKEVTFALAKLDPADPTRYDFALARLGILDLCQRRYEPQVCRQCELLTVCRFTQGTQGIL